MAIKNTKSYEEYLQSPAWQSKRHHIAVLRNYTCEKCKKVVKTGFHIHHKTYRHFGDEKDNELMFLCESCHKKLHINKNLQKAKTRKRKTITCKYCLSKISHKKYIEDFLTHCPYCNRYIGRPTSYKNPYNKFM
jgi:5-methylcytosine-specific restriction endonuclease McrA